MSYKQDTELEVKVKIDDKDDISNYIVSSQHRKSKGNARKSIWSISQKEEFECFVFSKVNKWCENHCGWGIHVVNNSLGVLGYNKIKDETKELKFAKFIDGNQNKTWHGYPADYMTKVQDIPSTNVLYAWVQNGYITKAKMSKILQGQRCNL